MDKFIVRYAISEQALFDDKFIFEIDEIPIYFDLVPRKMVDKEGIQGVLNRTTGAEKRHITVI